MNYQLATIKTTDMLVWDKILINQQEQIKEQFGEPLKLTKVYSLIKQKSKNFTVEDEQALEADARLVALLHARGFWKGEPKVISRLINQPKPIDKAKKIKIAKAKAKARMRVLKLKEKESALVDV